MVLQKDYALQPPLQELKKEYAIRFEIKPIGYSNAPMVSILYLSTGKIIHLFTKIIDAQKHQIKNKPRTMTVSEFMAEGEI